MNQYNHQRTVFFEGLRAVQRRPLGEGFGTMRQALPEIPQRLSH